MPSQLNVQKCADSVDILCETHRARKDNKWLLQISKFSMACCARTGTQL
jgi:hypothetical protein